MNKKSTSATRDYPIRKKRRFISLDIDLLSAKKTHAMRLLNVAEYPIMISQPVHSLDGHGPADY